MITDKEILNRSALLLGDEVMGRLSEARVIIFGVGGVGSWCAESLVRTGLKHLTIVDNDCVAPSNINRQLMATVDTVGEPKVEALKRRLLTLLPDAEIDARRDVFSAETASGFDLESYDYIIDAIDSLRDKMLLIQLATRTHARFYSSMGAALKVDPTRVRVAEFFKVQGCPLARALRQRFKKSGCRPGRKFKCVYSDELVPNAFSQQEAIAVDGAGAMRAGSTTKAQVNGSLMHITAIFGLTLAGLVIDDVRTRQ